MNIIEIALLVLVVGIVILIACQHTKLKNLEERTEDTFSRVQGIVNELRSGKWSRKHFCKSLLSKYATAQTPSLLLHYVGVPPKKECIFVDTLQAKGLRPTGNRLETLRLSGLKRGGKYMETILISILSSLIVSIVVCYFYGRTFLRKVDEGTKDLVDTAKKLMNDIVATTRGKSIGGDGNQ